MTEPENEEKAPKSKKIGQYLAQVGARMSSAGEDRDAEFMSDVNSATLQGPGRSSHLILWATALFILVALTWAAFAELDEVTVGDGRIIPSSKLQVVQNLEGGILTEILVKEGQTVDRDQPLLRLDDTRFSSTYQENRVKYYDLLAKSARLSAEAQGREYKAPPEVMEEFPNLARSQEEVYRSRQEELASSIDILKQKLQQRKQELEEITARRNQLRGSYSLTRQELRMSEPLVKQGAISRVEILRLKRSVNELRGQLEEASLAIPRVETSIVEAETKIKEAGLSFRTKAVTELNDVKAELSAISESIRAMKDRVTRTVVRSPVKGTVKRLLITTVGGVVQPGMDLAEIVPLEDTLLVEARVKPADIAFVRPGQEAMVTLTAYDFSIYGGLEGKLEHISADTINFSNSSTVDRDNFYVIRVRTNRSYLGSQNDPLNIIPGMTAVVNIKTGRKSVLDYLLKPILKTRERALRER